MAVMAEQTAGLRPLKGRARPLAEKSLGHPDPGAVSFALIATRIAAHLDSAAGTTPIDLPSAHPGLAQQGVKA